MQRAKLVFAALMVMVALLTTIAVPAMAANRGEGRHEARIDHRLGLTEGSRADRLQDRGFFGNGVFNCVDGFCGINRFCFDGFSPFSNCDGFGNRIIFFGNGALFF